MNIGILKEKNTKINWNLHNKITIQNLKSYFLKTENVNIKQIIRLLEYDYSIIDFEIRINKIKELKNDSNSKKSYILRYGIKEGIRLFKKRNNRSKITSSKKYLEATYGVNRSNEILKNRCPNNIKTLKNKYPYDWESKYRNYLKNYKFSNSELGYIKKYGEIEGKKKWSNRVQRRKIFNSELGYIKKYGEIEGKKKWTQKSAKHSYRMSKQYYVEKYGKILGSKLCAENSICGLIKKQKGLEYFKLYQKEKGFKSRGPIKDKLIKKYGEIEGLNQYNKYIQKQKYAHTLNYFIEKYGKDGLKKYEAHNKRIIDNLINSKNKSNISIELFNTIHNKLNSNEVYYSTYNKEKFIRDNDNNKLLFYDFTYKNKIIEFNGDFWHMNPKKYNKTDINPKTKLSALNIWNFDKYKNKIAKNKGYDIKTIWESDYKKNKNKIINECLIFLNDE